MRSTATSCRSWPGTSPPTPRPPDDGVVALWDGFGALVGFFGDGPSRAFLTSATTRTIRRCSTEHPRPVQQRLPEATWQDGILSREISEGPRLQLPGRDYVLFSGGAMGLHRSGRGCSACRGATGWARSTASPPSAQSPNILWPKDRTWVMVSEIDYDSTIVAGSPDLVRAICTGERLEAKALRVGADLTWDADEVNR
ncbi:hypothetical protein AB1285_20615 [Microbacterium sp. NRRL B-14842]|uniref:hypothetical protein n=1 Tax=Microbacterium sp. NRRL B-14842 TaxID=3162881 RepID=UPI003D2CF32F